jgi:hypothetical protein
MLVLTLLALALAILTIWSSSITLANHALDSPFIDEALSTGFGGAYPDFAFPAWHTRRSNMLPGCLSHLFRTRRHDVEDREHADCFSELRRSEG